MNSIDEEEEEDEDDDDDDGDMTIRSVEQFPSVRPPSESRRNNNICSNRATSEQTIRWKSQPTNRSTSLPSREIFSSNINSEENVKQRRRYASDSNNKNLTTTTLVTSFIQYLRCELRATTNDQKHEHLRIHQKKSTENIPYLSPTFNLSNHFYRQQYPIRMSTSPSATSSSSVEFDSHHLSNDDLLKNTSDDQDDNEIFKLINLLILRVECLANEDPLTSSKKNSPTIKQIDQDLIEYLYYLFNKFIKDDTDLPIPMIDKSNFVNVCQTLVRNGCFNLPASTTSPDQSFSELTITNSNDRTLTQTFLHEYRPETDQMSLEKSSINEQSSPLSMNDQETWLVVDIESIKPPYSATTPEQSKCCFPSSTSDEQFLLPNENYYSLEEIKSCAESESSHSNYYSPNSSLVDLQNMVQEFDEINNTNNNNNNNNTLLNEDGSSSAIDQAANNTQLIIEGKETTSTNHIYQGLTIDYHHEHVGSSTIESSELMTMKPNEKISRREKKMQERWTISTKNDQTEPLPHKTFLGVEFPPIAVLRKKFSSLSPSPPILNPLPVKKKDNYSIKNKTERNPPPPPATSFKTNQEIKTSIVEKTKHDQMFDLQTNDTSPLNDSQNNDIQQLSKLLTEETNGHEEMTIKTDALVTNLHKDQLIMDSDLFQSSSSSSLLSISSLMTDINADKTIEFLLKEIEEEGEKKEEEYVDENNVDGEKKNDCNIEHIDHASGTILINGEPTQVVLLEQEKKEEEEEEEETEQPTPLLLTQESCNQPQPDDEPLVPILSNNLENMTMTNIDQNEQRYKTVEIEEIPDEEEDLSIYNNSSIEPTDFILTDDELITPRPSNIKTTTDNTPAKVDPVLSCYEKALSKAVETIDDSTKLTNVSSKASEIPPTLKRHQRPEDDPIALRALERFEQRMNAAKTNNDETNPSITKRKSSWSGTFSGPRKSVENLFKTNQPSQPNSLSNGDQSTTPTTSAPQRDTFIRPRKTMLDDVGLNFGMTLNLFGPVQNNLIDNNDHPHHHQKLEEQQQPTAIVEDDNKQIVSDESTTNFIDLEDQQQPMNIHSSMTNERSVSNEAENSNSLLAPSLDSSAINSPLNTVISHSSTEQQSLTPYCLQLEGRRRLNTLERIRERRLNHEPNDLLQQQQLPPPPPQSQHEYTLRPEDLQDPIIRRALERFDEKSRSLAQSKSSNYDEIQDPITRRALMRLETNLKRTNAPNPPPPTNNDANETWYTNSYTLGSLQTNNDHRVIRYPDSSLSPTSNHKPTHISVHQRFCSTSSADMPEASTNNIPLNNEQNIPTIRVPTQPVYVTTNNHQQQPPSSLRQRSRSEDMLSSKDLSLGQTTNLDDHEISPLQRNHSSDELQQQETALSNGTDFQLPNTIMTSLDPNFIRTAAASVNYETPTQSYSAYSCEYIRPHRDQLVSSLEPAEVSSPRNLQQQQENEIQYPNSSSSTFIPAHPLTNNYYPQQPLPTPSYNSMYTSNNSNPTPYSDDPIVRRALERFNSQMQNSLINMSPQQANLNHISRQFSNGYPPRQGNFDPYHPPDPHQYETWMNSNRPMPPSANINTGYQSIIGRRRQMRHDDVYHDNTSVGNGYSSSLFVNPPNSYPYMNFSDEPPAIPPRLHRDLYHEQQEYLSENMNNNNNNHPPPYIPHPYPTLNGFHPYFPPEFLQQFQEDEYLRHRAQSTSSTTSSDSVNPIRFMQQRLPPTSTRTNLQQNKTISPDDSQLPSGRTTPSNGSATGDSVFQRLAYTATKSSLSKSSSNLCANLTNKNPPQQKSSSFKAPEIDYEEPAVNNEQNQESMPTPTNLSTKCQRSRSVDGRARLKSAQSRTTNPPRPPNDEDDSNHSTTVPSSKFTSVNPRRDVPPPRLPTTPRSIISDRTSLTKRTPNGHNLPYPKNVNGVRTRNSNGNLIDSENEENLAFNDNYQPKIIDNKTRTPIPVHRYPTNNNNNHNNSIQTSASTSSVNSTNFRTKVPILTTANLDRRDSNISNTDSNKSLKRSDDNRLLSPNGQRRNIPVSVFAPAKLENKRPAPPIPPASTSPTNESTSTSICDSQQDPQTSYSSAGDSSYTTINNENDINNKLSASNASLKTSTGNILSELSLTNDKHDNSKKMNVFERLFRGHKKKI